MDVYIKSKQLVPQPISQSVDVDAQAFITAANITDTSKKIAINQLVINLKAYGIWSKMKAIYPFIGGTASTHKWNLKDPRDLDAAFRLVFNGGWTHSSTGTISNGTNAYADTKLIPNTIFSTNYAHQSIYLRNNVNTFFINGCVTNPNINRFDFGYDTNKIPGHSIANTGSSLGTNDSRTDGFLLSFRTGVTNGKFKRNNIDKIISLPNFTSYSIYSYFYGARNQNNFAQFFTIQEIAFATIGDGLTDTDATNLSWITEQYQTMLGRSVNPWYDNGNLLLDLYPSAAVAYSLRKLRNYYIGAAIRVRRSSDNAEQDIYFDSTGNLDTASLLSFVGAGNGFVTRWYDQSGNERHGTQSTAGRQPRIVNAGVLETILGKTCIRFDGADDYLLFNQFTLSGNFSNFVVGKREAINRALMGFTYSGNGSQALFALFNNNRYYFRPAVNQQLSSNSTDLTTDYSLLTFINSPSPAIYKNDNVIVSTSSTVTSGLIVNNIGWHSVLSPAMFAGIQESILYNNSDQSANRIDIQNNINSYYYVYSSAPIWDGSQLGILDSYPNAAAAYSVRALNSAYRGALIRVRRSSDNAEADVFALQNGELDTAYLLNFVGLGNGFVTKWYDQSGNGFDVYNNTPANQPRIVSTGSLILQNDKLTIQFNGNNTVLWRGYNNTNIFQNISKGAIYMASKQITRAAATAHCYLTIGRGTSNTNPQQQRFIGSYWHNPQVYRSETKRTDLENAGTLETTTITNISTMEVISNIIEYDLKSISIYQNSTLIGQNTSIPNAGNTENVSPFVISIGGQTLNDVPFSISPYELQMNANLSEMIIYHNINNQTLIENNIRNYFGI